MGPAITTPADTEQLVAETVEGSDESLSGGFIARRKQLEDSDYVSPY